jgi:hypothetical protein
MKLNIFSRFVAIWKPDFLKKFAKEDSAGPTMAFWFFWSSIVAIIMTVVVMFNLGGFEKNVVNEIPEGKFVLKNGALSTEGVNEPIFIEFDNGNSVFVLDTKGVKYDKTILDKYQTGFFVSSSEWINKQSVSQTQAYQFSTFKENFTFSKQNITDWLNTFSGVMYAVLGVIIFIGVWMGTALFRLLTAFWWALIFWIVAMIANVEPYKKYMKVYMAVLNFYIIPLILETLLLGQLLQFQIPFGTTILFGIFFGLGFWWIKKDKQAEPAQATAAVASEVKKEEKVPKSAGKK